MREVTATGQTVDEAVQSALEQLNTSRDQVEIDIIDEGKKGILGVFGAKRAIVKVRLAKNPVQEAEKYILNVIKNMNIEVDIKTTVKDNHVTYELSGDKIALLIGKRGQTLNALQYLIHLVVNKEGNKYFTVTLDAEGYRERRRETLETLALRMADKAKRFNKKVALEPMPAYERKIIHSVLQDKNDVSTYSDGVEPHRHVVIKP
ncbi:RNA-binding cell elongation regulator Jag/EloR [Ornithinibacillus halotolerans]|uniref:RNA-binding protein KhpB n=1 Tax=Ornithinibacillus halotolerans TaxID=1274357 RepID=A0A916RW08_9BACI|nr:RNA-binding cell elongation regulator Jag/EloR [Ornithinibacillus halotolerans]GGA70396.1 Jag protein [Ornithinibacillus halotolerans]